MYFLGRTLIHHDRALFPSGCLTSFEDLYAALQAVYCSLSHRLQCFVVQVVQASHAMLRSSSVWCCFVSSSELGAVSVLRFQSEQDPNSEKRIVDGGDLMVESSTKHCNII